MEKQPVLEIIGITKSFGGVEVLKNVSFPVYKNEIVGLLGANGAGKSTLMKIIGASLRADRGHITLDGTDMAEHTPQAAKQRGIISVYQELNLFQNLSITENLFLGKEIKSKAGTIKWKKATAEAQAILDGLGLGIDASTPVGNLSVAQQHLVEIARAIHEKPKILLLDEPTASLSEKEIEWLFERIRELTAADTTVVYVSHRLDEAVDICDRCVILRDGELVKASEGKLAKDEIIRYMIGREITLKRESNPNITEETVFECRNVTTLTGVRNINFSVHRGEILGIAGLVGAGRTELLRALFGIDPIVDGDIYIKGKKASIKNPAQAFENGVALIPEDRKLEGLFLDESACFNIGAVTIDERKKGGIVYKKREMTDAKKAAAEVMLDVQRLLHPIKQLSGGNQQKVVIAKTLLANTDVLLLDEPTRGVDIGARDEIYNIIKNLSRQGKAIVLVSSDWEELTYLSDRLVVLAEGRMTGELPENASEVKIMELSTVTVKADTQTRKAVDEKKSSWLSKAPRLTAFLKNNTAVLLAMIVALLIFGLATSESFRTWINMRNLFSQAMPLLLLTLGQLVVIIAGGMDLSIGTLMSACSVLGCTIMIESPNLIWVAILAMLGLGVVTGIANALLVVKANVNAFVVTIGMMVVMEGVALVITPKPIGPAPAIFREIANGAPLGVPNVILLMIAFIAIFYLLLKFTPLGRRFYAVGENSFHSYYAGLPVTSTKIFSFVMCSVMGAVTALFMLGRTGAADPSLGLGLELDSIACVLIGGATLAGGKGSLAGAVCGVFMLTLLSNIFSMHNIDTWYQDVISGVLLLTIIILSERSLRRQHLKKAIS